MYTFSARARFECPFVLVVVTPDAATARWASQRIELGGSWFWAPLVVGPDGIPIITDIDRARREPELAVLSVMAHGRGEPQTALAVALAAAAAIEQISDEQRMLYSAFIETALGDAARKAFEMHPQGDKFLSDSQRRSFEKGRAEGRAAEKAADVLDVLDARGLTLSSEQRERILSCADLDVLKTWLRRAATVATIDALFE